MIKRKHVEGRTSVPQRNCFRQRPKQANLPFFNKVLALYTFLFLVLLVAVLQKRIPAQLLLRDPLAITGGAFYYGLFSNIGALVWCASAVICFFSVLLLKRLGYQSPFQSLLLASGCLTFLLLLDDFFLLHEDAFPNYLGLSGKVLFGAYGITVILYLVRFRKIIQKTNYIVLAIAFAFLAASMLVDLMDDFGLLTGLRPTLLGHGRIYVLEDGLKLFGIVTWLIYFAQVGLRQVQLAARSRD